MAAADVQALRVGILPGTGRMGSLLARHLAKAGISIFLGSRSAERGIQAALTLISPPPPHIQGGSNAEAAAWANTIVWCPSFGMMVHGMGTKVSEILEKGSLQDRAALLQSLAPQLENKVIIDVTNVMYFYDESQWGQTSSVLLNQKALGVPARWATAFKATFWKLLEKLPDPQNPHHTFVAGDDEEAILTTIAVVEAIPGFKALRAGGLANSKIIELLGPLWLFELDKLNAGGKYRSGWKYGM